MSVWLQQLDDGPGPPSTLVARPRISFIALGKHNAQSDGHCIVLTDQPLAPALPACEARETEHLGEWNLQEAREGREGERGLRVENNLGCKEMQG
jgi:hypothetical protein